MTVPNDDSSLEPGTGSDDPDPLALPTPSPSATKGASGHERLALVEVASLLRTALTDWTAPPEDAETPTPATAQSVLAQDDQAEPSGTGSTVPRSGTLIGRYRLLELLGEGGFGMVWKAEQISPIQRWVALKIVKSGVACSQVLARFNAERQALASMDHAGIAAILDANTTPSGEPYFVMELVPGEPVTTACRRLGLDLTQRLSIFQKICKAVQHAHQKGVLHRDLKPSNILLYQEEGEFRVKIIDFGIAKAREAPAFLEAPLLTRSDHLLGTPDYMSPEQTILGNQDLDTRTDIYSLGAILYELLTGFPPLQLASCETSTLSDALHAVRSREPAAPSIAVRRLLLGTPPDSQHVDPILLTPAYADALQGDLDWITLKALAKIRDERYESADALAADIACHLEDLPISAGRPTFRLQARKFLRRNRTLVFSSAALIGILTLSVIAVTRAWIAERASRATADHMRDLAVANAETAEHESERARETLHFLDKLLDQTGEMVRAGKNPEALRLALDHLTADPTVFGTNPEIQQAILGSTAQIYRALRNDALALPMYERQAALLAQLRPPDAPDLLEARENLARAYFLGRRNEESLREYRDIIAIRKAQAHTRDGLRKLFLIERNYLDVLAKTGHLELALVEYQRIHELATDEIRRHSSWPVFLRHHAEALIRAERWTEAETICREGLSALDLSKPEPLHHASGLQFTLANLHVRRKNLGAAVDALEHSIRSEIRANGPLSPWLFESRLTVARLQSGAQQHSVALAHSLQALHTVQETANEPLRVPALRALAECLHIAGQYAEAARRFEECVRLSQASGAEPDLALALDQGQQMVNLCLANRSQEARLLLPAVRAAGEPWISQGELDLRQQQLLSMLGFAATRSTEERHRPPPDWTLSLAQRLALQQFPALQFRAMPPNPAAPTSLDWLALFVALQDPWMDSDPAAAQIAEAAFLRLAGRHEQAVRVYLQTADRPGENLMPDRHLTARSLAVETLFQLQRAAEASPHLSQLRRGHAEGWQPIRCPQVLAKLQAWSGAPPFTGPSPAPRLSPTAPPQTPSPSPRPLAGDNGPTASP